MSFLGKLVLVHPVLCAGSIGMLMLLRELCSSLSWYFLSGWVKEIWCHFAVEFLQVTKLA